MGGLDVPCQVTELILQSGKKWEIPGPEADLGEVQPLLEKYSPPFPNCSKSPAQKAYVEDSVRYDSSLCHVQNVPTTFIRHIVSTIAFWTQSPGQDPALEGVTPGGTSSE